MYYLNINNVVIILVGAYYLKDVHKITSLF